MRKEQKTSFWNYFNDKTVKAEQVDVENLFYEKSKAWYNTLVMIAGQLD